MHLGKNWKRVGSVAVVLLSVSALSFVCHGMYKAIHSPLFTVNAVDIADQPQDAPVDAATLLSLASVPIGKIGLFSLNLRELEERILKHPWIRQVHLKKSFPDTLALSVVFREAAAFVQLESGELAYVEMDGHIFGKADLGTRADLPILSGFSKQPKDRLVEALHLLESWSKAGLDAVSQLAALSYDSERGYRAVVSYPLLGGEKEIHSGRGRTMVDLGHELGPETHAHLGRLRHVFKYLGSRRVAVRQIWADTGKKIVVKTARGS